MSKELTEAQKEVVDLLDAGCCYNCPFAERGGLEGLSEEELRAGKEQAPLSDFLGRCHAGPKQGFQLKRDGAVVFVFPDVNGAEFCGLHPIRRAQYLDEVEGILEEIEDEAEDEKEDEG